MQSGGMYPDSQLLVHMCTAADWAAALEAGEVRPAAPGDTGFVHLSTQQQVHLPANRVFAGRRDVKVLYVDPRRLAAPLRWEPGVPGDPSAMLFPHLYGPLPLGAVVQVADYLPDADGRFAPLA